MTDRRPSLFAVAAGALGLFLVVFALLAFQLRAHSHAVIATAPTPARQVLQRRVVVRKVIVVLRRDDDGGTAPGTAAVGVAQPTTRVSPAGPAPAPAPAAPLVSRTSGAPRP